MADAENIDPLQAGVDLVVDDKWPMYEHANPFAFSDHRTRFRKALKQADMPQKRIHEQFSCVRVLRPRPAGGFRQIR